MNLLPKRTKTHDLVWLNRWRLRLAVQLLGLKLSDLRPLGPRSSPAKMPDWTPLDTYGRANSTACGHARVGGFLLGRGKFGGPFLGRPAFGRLGDRFGNFHISNKRARFIS